MDASRERIVTLVGLLLAMLLVRWLAAEALDPAPESWVRGENSAPGDGAATGLVFPEPGEPGSGASQGDAQAPTLPVAPLSEPAEPEVATPEVASQSGGEGWDVVGGLADGLQAAVQRRVTEAVGEADRLGGKAVRAEDVQVSVRALDLRTRRGLVGLASRALLRPASNHKLLTAAAALVLLGADGELQTPFLAAQGAVQEGAVLRGYLVARAGADPVHDPDGDGSLGPWLDPLVQALQERGVVRIEGDLVLDEGTFLEPGPAPEWPSTDQHWKEYCALSGGFSANAGCLQATLVARSPGANVPVSLRPRGHGLEERLGVRAVASSKPLDVRVGVAGRRATVRGDLPSSAGTWVARFRHPDPVELFGGAVVAQLAEAGVTLSGSVRRERGAPAGELLAVCRSKVAAHLLPVLRDSNNSVADQLWLAAGLDGSGRGDREGAALAVARALEELGLEAGGLVAVDGSGLSRADRTSSRQLAAVLAALAERPEALRVLLETLPEAGRTGSLEARMAGTPAEGRVRAKTGFIGGTSGLSGYVLDEHGPRIAFSILVNYPRAGGLNTRVFKPLQDDICREFVAWLDR